ncbi:MAG: hypothetical protein FJZ57_00015 [Chlamydiae bacterium]|nr:hypothetical protein [Chlamydiota bacterium]
MNSDQNHLNEQAKNETIENAVEPSFEDIFTKNESLDETTEKKQRPKEASVAFRDLLNKIDSLDNVEEKISSCIQFMKHSLADSIVPKFRDFWDARKYCLPLFKDQMAVKIRSELWQEYVDLSTEARRLKDVLDEQSAFAFEQIELAIQALIKDLEDYNSSLEAVVPVDIPTTCSTLLPSKDKYALIQSNLQLLNVFASRVNSLRKEVIRTEMRIKNKNKLFEKLSAAGDLVFPKRKSFIKEISEMFVADVDSFMSKYFHEDVQNTQPLHVLREEIKSLQNIAKILTINAQSFTSTRLKLSQCWDMLKVWEKERKKEISHKKQVIRQNYEVVHSKIKEFEQFCLDSPSFSDATKQFEEVLAFMKTIELSFSEQKSLKDELFKARKPVWDKEKEKQIEKELKEKEALNLKRKQVEDFKNSLESLITSHSSIELDDLIQKRQEMHEQMGSLTVSKSEKMLFEKLFKQLRDVIDERKSEKLMTLSDTDRQKLDDLVTLLEERKVRRNEIRSQIESYRKILGGSGFDFEKAMMYRELIEAEKVSLDKVNTSIQELEEKVAEIEG